jgi:hypothetical protein
MSDDINDFAIDSLDQAELLIDIEEAFYLDISEEAAKMFSTVQNLFDYIVEHTKEETLSINWERSTPKLTTEEIYHVDNNTFLR